MYIMLILLGRAKVIFVSAVELASAMTAIILIVVDAGVAYPDGSFHAPAFVQNPLVSIRDAGSVKVPLIAMMP